MGKFSNQCTYIDLAIGMDCVLKGRVFFIFTYFIVGLLAWRGLLLLYIAELLISLVFCLLGGGGLLVLSSMQPVVQAVVGEDRSKYYTIICQIFLTVWHV